VKAKKRRRRERGRRKRRKWKRREGGREMREDPGRRWKGVGDMRCRRLVANEVNFPRATVALTAGQTLFLFFSFSFFFFFCRFLLGAGDEPRTLCMPGKRSAHKFSFNPHISQLGREHFISSQVERDTGTPGKATQGAEAICLVLESTFYRKWLQKDIEKSY
jgi:hypothetical protein